MVSFNKLTRTLAGIAAAALIVPLAACGGSGNGGTATAEGIPAKGTDDGTEITLWTRSPLERQAKNVVEAYNKSHKNQVKLEIIPSKSMAWITRPTCSRATSKPVLLTAPSTPCRSSPMFP